jgi:hypothetical protein
VLRDIAVPVLGAYALLLCDIVDADLLPEETELLAGAL